MTIENICSGFKKTGVYPFKPEAILKDYPAASDLSEGNSSADELDVEPAKLTVQVRNFPDDFLLPSIFFRAAHNISEEI